MANTVIAQMLVKLAKTNDEKSNSGDVTFYDAVTIPSVSILDMIKRWMKFSRTPNEVIIMAAIYIDRASSKGLVVTSHSVHRVLLSALVVAAKYHCDRVHGNSHYAKVGGVAPTELNRLEATFIQDLEWELYIKPSEFESVCKNLTGLVTRS
eukprot:TRINITY_DN528_c1_g1_i1.p1 TRINITY_DN528_c1_g1~~TRINITY_DN528_c1_g1_i1.p1  ORF type:complete len:174 (+),score=26.86 TRINITY_DN528_c1_g1_i1:67-522(+)